MKAPQALQGHCVQLYMQRSGSAATAFNSFVALLNSNHIFRVDIKVSDFGLNWFYNRDETINCD